MCIKSEFKTILVCTRECVRVCCVCMCACGHLPETTDVWCLVFTNQPGRLILQPVYNVCLDNTPGVGRFCQGWWFCQTCGVTIRVVRAAPHVDPPWVPRNVETLHNVMIFFTTRYDGRVRYFVFLNLNFHFFLTRRIIPHFRRIRDTRI